jgi:hypothetical protein
MKQSDLTATRGEIVESFLNLEWIVSLIISQKYFRKLDMTFLEEVLCDDAVTFGLRINVLEKIAPKFPCFQELRKLNKIRNSFAHCHRLVLEVDEQAGTGIRRSVHPKKPASDIDFEDLAKHFRSLYEPVAAALMELLFELGGRLEPPDRQVPIVDQ